MKTRVSVFLIILAIVLPSCSKDSFVFSYRDRADYTVDSVFFNKPCIISETVPESARTVILTAFNNTNNDIDNSSAEVMFATSLDISQSLSGLLGALDNGKLLIILRPEEEQLKTLLSARFSGIDGLDLSNLSLFAFSGNGDFYFMTETPYVDYENYIPLISWIKKVLGGDDLLEDDLFQPSHKSFIIKDTLNKEITHVKLSSPDRLSGTVTVNGNVEIIALHGFGDTAADGYDYYIIHPSISIQSNQMYSGNFTKKHGGVRARICGYYLKGMNFEFSMTNAKGESVGEFCHVPLPATSAGSTTYKDSLSWSLDGLVTGALKSSYLKAGLTYKSEIVNNIPDVSLYNNHHDNVAAYKLSLGNLPSFSSKLAITNPPLTSIATLDMTCYWIWRVKVDDGKTDTFYAKFKYDNLTYGASYFYTTKADYHDLEFTLAERSAKIDLPVPERNAMGTVLVYSGRHAKDSICLLNTATKKVYTRKEDREIYEINVPEGTYEARYYNGNEVYSYDKKISVPRCGTVSLDMRYGFNKEK